jgi:hypothetical protein
MNTEVMNQFETLDCHVSAVALTDDELMAVEGAGIGLGLAIGGAILVGGIAWGYFVG